MEFCSFEELSDCIKKISEQNFCIYSINDCRSIENANKRVALGQIPYKKKFKYSFVKYACKHFGDRKSRSAGVRPNQRTYKTGCGSYIYASVDRVKDKFVILKSDLIHNHKTDEELFVRYPEQRRVTNEEKQLIDQLVGLNVPSGTICKHLQEVTGRRLTVKDIQNIKNQGKTNDDLSDIFSVLEDFCSENDNNTVIIDADKEGAINCIWFQTAVQQETLQRFPEILHIDGTYRVNNRRMPLYVAMIEDGCGKGFAVAYALLSNEQRENIDFFVRSLKSTNPLLENQVKCFIVDKDFAQISVITSLFPNVHILLCRFHVLKTFRHEVSKLKLPENEKNIIRQYLQALVYANTEDMFNNRVRLLQKVAPKDFMQYFTENWDNCRPRWAAYITNTYQNFNTKTNNRIERHNQELKKTLNSHITVAECLRRILQCNQRCFSRKDHQLFMAAVCHSYNVLDEETVVKKIRTTATLYAAQATIQQYRKAMEMKSVTFTESSPSMYQVLGHSVDMSNVQPKCTCSFSSSMGLPCRHIFAIIHNCSFPFSEDYIPDRWRKSYQYKSVPVTCKTEVAAIKKGVERKLSRKEKFNIMHRLFTEISDACSEVSQDVFEDRFSQVTLMRNAWVAGDLIEVHAHASSVHITSDAYPQDVGSNTIDTATVTDHEIMTENPSQMKLDGMTDVCLEDVVHEDCTDTGIPSTKHEHEEDSKHVTEKPNKKQKVAMSKDMPKNNEVIGISSPNHEVGEVGQNVTEKLEQKQTYDEMNDVFMEDVGPEDFDHRRLHSDFPDHKNICDSNPVPCDLDLQSTDKWHGSPMQKGTQIKRSPGKDTEEPVLKESVITLNVHPDKESPQGILKRQKNSLDKDDHDDKPPKKRKTVSFKEQVQGLHLPTVSKVRGRPKGCNSSIVGLPKRTRRQQEMQKISSRNKTYGLYNSSSQRHMDSFEEEVFNFADVRLLQELIDFLSTQEFTSPKRSIECVSMIQNSCMPPANSIMFEAGKQEDKIDYVTDTLSTIASNLIKEELFQRRTDIFQLLVATIMVAADNHLQMDAIKEMFSIYPSHLVKTSNEVQPTKGKLRVGGTTFTHADLGTLRQGRWINDQIIHAYLNLLMHEHDGKVYILPSFLGLKWEKSNYGEWLFRKVDFMNYRWLMMPVFKNHHWFLLVADTVNHTVCFFNSIPNAAEEQTYFDHWSKYITTRNKLTASKIPQFKNVSCHQGRQFDGHSCGVFVLMNAEAILGNANPAVMRHHHAPSYRRYVKQRLLENSHSNNNLMCDLPFCRKPAGVIKWVQCDSCSRWCHYQCCNTTIVQKGTFHCVLCTIE